ncbi:MAG: hypothetical protein KBG20_18865 [Caldilineaceae bacterium]|nr:hypothetical protein [Caldilineaceae bacterium]MBP8108452.1 hypothetical protein [Caldilineaceae bacterium]MBP8124614.1 hypothetical protein [Caldilineaceae bacterium]MBP9074376.1 hypothetical protein [Caldilineaceae bacterium]
MPKSLRLSTEDSTVHARMRAVLSSIQQEFDFSTFTWPGFVDWLSQRQGKQVLLVPIPTESSSLFGGWISTAAAEFIFFDKGTLPMHQIHIQLHEIAHMLCGHSTFHADQEHMSQSQEEIMALAASAMRMRHVAESETEQEAEILTALIQSAIFSHGRQEALTRFDFQNHDEEVLVYMMELG